MNDSSLLKFVFSSFTDLRDIYRILTPRLRTRFWMILFLQTVTAILESSTIIIISFFALSLSSPDVMREHFIVRKILPYLPEYVNFRLKGDRTFVTAMCLMVVVFIGMKNAMSFISAWFSTRFSEKIGYYISREVLSRYFNKNYLWHISGASQDMIMRLNFRGNLTQMTTAILQLIGNCICAMVVFGSLLFIEPWLTVTTMVTFSVVCTVVFALLRKKIDRTGRDLADLSGRETTAYNIAQRGIREIITYRKQDVFLESITGAMRKAIPLKSFLSVSGSLPAWILETAAFANIFGVMFVQIARGVPMPRVIAAISMLLLSAWRILPSVSRIMGSTVQIRGLRTMALSCLELLQGGMTDVKPEKHILPDPDFRFDDSLQLKNVSFTYPGAPAPCLKSLDLTIKKGESIGLIGVSGAGKTTLAMLLAGLLEPETGEYSIDGNAMTPERLESLHGIVGLVPQNPLLLPGTIADNVALSKWGEEYDRDKVHQTCEYAAMDFIENNADGIDMRIGDGGDGLSGGQAQRVAIARALFCDPEILVFDEATSALDLASESNISRTIQNIKGKVTTIIVAHRLSTIETCDRVFWIEDGKVQAEGAPKTILPQYSEQLIS